MLAEETDVQLWEAVADIAGRLLAVREVGVGGGQHRFVFGLIHEAVDVDLGALLTVLVGLH